MKLKKLLVSFMCCIMVSIIFNSCSKMDESYQDAPNVFGVKVSNHTQSEFSIDGIRSQIEGKFKTQEGKNLLWDQAYSYNHNDQITATIIPIQISNELKYEFLAVGEINGVIDLAQVTFTSNNATIFTPEIYSIRPYEIINRTNFKGKIKLTTFKAYSFNSQPSSCASCHEREDAGSVLFPDEVLDEIVINVPGPISGDIGQAPIDNIGIIILHPGPQIPNPCTDSNKAIKNNSNNLDDLLNALSGMVNTVPKTEKGITIDSKGSVTAYEGTANNPSMPPISLSPGSKYNAFVHTHYFGLLIGPSPADLFSLYDLANGGYINNYNSFEFGVLTSDGYMGVNIDNPQAFLNSFGYQTEASMNLNYLASNLMNGTGYPGTNNTTDSYATALNKLLNNINSGLSVYYRKKNQNGDYEYYYYDSSTKTMKKC